MDSVGKPCHQYQFSYRHLYQLRCMVNSHWRWLIGVHNETKTYLCNYIAGQNYSRHFSPDGGYCVYISFFMRLFIAPTAEFDHNFHSFPAPMTGLALQQGSILMTLFFAATTWTDSHYLYQAAMLNLRSLQGSTEKEKPFSHLIMVWKQVYRVCIFFSVLWNFFSSHVIKNQLSCHKI